MRTPIASTASERALPTSGRRRLAMLTLLCGLASSVGVAAPPAPRTPSARAVYVTGVGDMLPPRNGALDAAGVGTPTPLRGRGIPVPLNAQVRPAPGHKLVVRFGPRDSVVLNRPEWHPVMAPARPDPAAEQFMQAMGATLQLAGRERSGTEDQVCWPRSGVALCPSLASIRWSTRSTGNVNLKLWPLTDLSGSWVASAPAASGRYDGADLRGYLATARNAEGYLALFAGGLRQASATPMRVRIMDAPTESLLLARLEAAAPLESPAKQAVRASILLDAGLQAEAADEYEQAAAAAPEDSVWLRKAIDLHRAYGNRMRAEQLRRGSTIPAK